MAAPVTDILVQAVNNIYRYLDSDSSVIDENTVFQEPRIPRQNLKYDLCFPLIPLSDCDAYLPAVVLFPEYKSYKIKISIHKVKEDLPVVSEGWTLPVESCSIASNTLFVLLNHKKSFERTLRALSDSETVPRSICSHKVIKMTKDPFLEEIESFDLTQLRINVAFKSLSNVYHSLGYKVETECISKETESQALKYHICHKSLCSEKGSEYLLILCGAVLDTATKAKANNISARDYLSQKKLVFENVTQGRVNPQDLSDQAETLAEAEVTAELLGVKLHDNVSVCLSQDSDNNGVTRGATFLLYNHVRLSCIRKKFEQEVECGTYPKLPSIENIEFGLLTQPEEWELLLLILQFPYWLVNCINPRGKISVHPVLVGLDKLCRVFSVYYRRVRVLTESRPQLLPVMFARLYLLQRLEQVLGIGLSILNMKSLDYM